VSSLLLSVLNAEGNLEKILQIVHANQDILMEIMIVQVIIIEIIQNLIEKFSIFF
jgi:hypothetical protein